ncbi:MAG: helix-turn-helix transcriptional regulator [Prevotella sp.]|nr:helix-turn-helix transcriptional regulator [Prevotella sp.]
MIIINMELNRIKEVLDERGIKQTWLAEKLGKSFSTMNAYSCNRKQPTLEMLNRIADILQVSVKELIVDDKTTRK